MEIRKIKMVTKNIYPYQKARNTCAAPCALPRLRMPKHFTAGTAKCMRAEPIARNPD